MQLDERILDPVKIPDKQCYVPTAPNLFTHFPSEPSCSEMFTFVPEGH